MTTVFLINGFNIRHPATQSEKMASMKSKLESMGYRVVLTDFSWRRKTISQFSEEFKKLYARNKTAKNIVIGNSFGAIVALLSSPDLAPDKLYLCSLSAYFKEDRDKHMDHDNIRRFGITRMQEFWLLSFNDIVKNYSDSVIDITVTYGEKEKAMHPSLVRRCQQAAALLPNARLMELPGAPHSMGDPVYLEQILKRIPALIESRG